MLLPLSSAKPEADVRLAFLSLLTRVELLAMVTYLRFLSTDIPAGANLLRGQGPPRAGANHKRCAGKKRRPPRRLVNCRDKNCGLFDPVEVAAGLFVPRRRPSGLRYGSSERGRLLSRSRIERELLKSANHCSRLPTGRRLVKKMKEELHGGHHSTVGAIRRIFKHA